MADEREVGDIERQTRQVVERLYDAYFEGDADGMVATMSPDVWIRFLGRVDFRGREKARAFLRENSPLLIDLQFRIRKMIVDGVYAAAVWDERARTVNGDDYRNHGVDVFRVEDGAVIELHENNDIRIHRQYFGS